MIGGVLTFQAARQSLFMDKVLDALSPEPEDRLVSYFLLMSAPLTFLSGLGLLVTSRWVLIPLGVLVISQIIYFLLKNQRLSKAKTPEEYEEHQVQSTTRNAFIVSLIIFALAIAGERWGILR